jgi:3-keto-disaccharide hydrolase
MMTKRTFPLALAVIVIVASLNAKQQAPPQPGAGSGQGRGGRGGGPRGAEPLVVDDLTGFQSIFDGKTLTGWDGDPSFWKVANGAIVGESTPTNAVKENTFLIWRGGEPRDFELKVQFKINSTNSGIQIRSVHLPQGTQVAQRAIEGKWVLKGYQADIDFANQFTGQIYEERGRGFLAMRGQAVYVPDGEGARPRIIGNLQQSPDELKAVIKQNDWNHVHLIARGNTITQILNGAVTSIVIDDDTKNRAMGGLIGFQLHVGEPMKLELRNIALKTVGR